MRKFLYALVLLLIVGAVGFFTLGPGMIEKSMNKVDGKPLPKVCLLYTSPSPRDGLLSRMPSSA